MQAMTWRGGARFTLDDVPEPVAAPGWVVVKIDTTGICGTDVHITQGLFPQEAPKILGHESAGIIVDVGDGPQRCRTRVAGRRDEQRARLVAFSCA